MKISKAALLPPLLALISFLMSPEFYNKLPDKYAHGIAGIAVILATLMPSLFSSQAPPKI